MCGRRDESLQIFSQACMFGAKLANAGKEVLPRVVLSAVLTGELCPDWICFSILLNSWHCVALNWDWNECHFVRQSHSASVSSRPISQPRPNIDPLV